jgi:hypothetical protein
MLPDNRKPADRRRAARGGLILYGLLNLACAARGAQGSRLRPVDAVFVVEGAGWLLISLCGFAPYALTVECGVDLWKALVYALNLWLFVSPERRGALTLASPFVLLLFEYSVFLSKLLQRNSIRPANLAEVAFLYSISLVVHILLSASGEPISPALAGLLLSHTCAFAWAVGLCSYSRVVATTFALGFVGRLASGLKVT